MDKIELDKIQQEINDKFLQFERISKDFDYSRYKNKEVAHYHGAKYLMCLINNIFYNLKQEEKND